MQSFNKITPFGDDTLHACIQAEVKNMNVLYNDSDMEKYFKDNVFSSKVTNKSNEVVGINQSKQNSILRAFMNTETSLNQNNSEFKELREDSDTKNSVNNETNTPSKLELGRITSLKKKRGLCKVREKDVNISCTRNDVSPSTIIIKSFNGNVTKSKAEKSLEMTPSILTICTQERHKLASWGLPPNILQKYELRGIKDMFAWQVECLSNHKVLEEKRNLVYSAPTSAGKTLVAEILMIKTVLETHKKVIFILPFVSVVREKMYYFQDLLSDSGIRVEGFMGGIAPPGGFTGTHVAIATIEKANSLVNRLMEENELINLGAVVIDELHLVGDSNRGYLLELLLTKLKYMTLRSENVNIQLIGMSATLPNLSILAEWLDAELYKTEFRPVPLNEQCKIGKNIYDNKLHLIRSLTPMAELIMDSDDILHLCIETVSDGHSVLIFCPTKNWCEKLAEQIATAFFKLGQKNTQLGETLRQQLNSTLISETLEQLKRSPIGLDKVLKNTVSFGIAFHHAGLTMDERDIIEGSFRSGSLRVLIATSTLSSGVNLPARRVIVRSPMFAGRLLDNLTYKQMIGRAGRMGKDTAGESILVCKLNERKAAESLLSATLEPIVSCLENSGPLIRAFLEAIASEVVHTASDLELYTKCMLINLSDELNPKNSSKEAIKFLVNNEFLLLQQTDDGHRWVATAFGKACLAASIPPRDGLFLLEELQKARRCFVLDTELHVIYLVTPLSCGNQIGNVDWMTFLELWKMLSESERRVGELVGVEERFLTSAIKGVVRPGKSLNIHKRFYTALALHDLVREVPLNTVCKKYGCCRGVLQSLQQSASVFAGMVTQFCKQLGWDCMELLVSQFQTRLQFGVCRELLDLLRLPMLNGLRARTLYKQGITCVADLAVANELDVERALYKALPFESEKEQDGEHESEAIKRNKMRTIFVTGKDGLTPREAAIMLVHEARVLVQNELKLQDMSWKQKSVTNESHTETSLQIQQDIFQSTECTNAQSTVKIFTYNNAQIKVHADNNVFQDKHSQSSCAINTQIITSVNQKKDLLSNKLYKNEKCKINTYAAENDKDSECDLKSKIRNNDLNVENVKNSKCYLENEKCNVNINVIVSEYNLEKDSTKENKNDDVKVTDQLLEIDIPKILDTSTEKLSLDFFEDSSFRMMDDSLKKRDSELLISFKDKKNRTQNCTFKHPVDDVQNAENINNIMIKKMRTSDGIDTGISACANAIIQTSSFGKDLELRVSKSPSLFDDSLNLDTQICNVLEQNIIDSLDFSEFEETKLSEHKLTMESKETPSLQTNQSDNNETQTEKALKDKHINKNSMDFTNLQAKHSTLLWEDDSWNVPIKVTEKLNQISDKNNEIFTKRNIKHVKNANIQHIVETADTSHNTPDMKKRYDMKFEKSTDIPNDLKKILHKRRLKDISTEKSPVANIIVFNHNRTASLDSNKSDSDDIIIASQNINSPAAGIKTQAKLDSGRKQKICTQKVVNYVSNNVTKFTSSVSNAIQIEKCNIKPKIKEILTTKVQSKNCSTDSIISNSDEDTPIKSPKILQKSKLTVRKKQKNPETCLQTKKINNINETVNWNTLNIIKVGSDRGTFNLFKREVMQKQYIALALNCEMYNNDTNSIGSRIISSTNTERKRSKKVDNYIYANKKLCGVAISWESNIAYYISFSNEQDIKVPSKEQMKLLNELLKKEHLNVKCFATKETFKTLYECCAISASCKFLDPKIATWLLDGTVYEKTFNEMVKEYFPQGCFITKRIGACYDTGPGLNVKSTIPGEFRASAEAVLTWYMTDTLLERLEQLSPTLLYTFKDIEMKIVTLLACMELTGFGVSLKSLQDLSSVIHKEMISLQERAFELSGKKINFSSSKEVGEILGLYKGRKVSVNKIVLGQSDHPISNLIMSWRKLNATLSKIVYPISNLAQHSSRIHGNCVTCTLTGRVSMYEPNLQNVPKDFNSEDNSFMISVRMAFVPAIGNIILSADYCQLELRILAHFSKDAILCDIMRKPGDIFKSIAAKWNHTSEGQVDDQMRQRTKQLCYGMIYGMGVKSLAENLSIDEIKAKEFLESFMNTYPGISTWLSSVVKEARINGYVTTILERRRMLPGLASTSTTEKSQAERQTVNTKIQGSAADIAKKAMVNIEDKMRFEFPNSATIMPAVYSTRKLRSNSREAQQRGGYLVLQLHDELLYEVNIKDLRQVATIVKESMEQVCQLAVPLPVKLKVGPAWGDLSEYTFQH